MASLIEELIDTLDKENTEYTELVKISKEKTSVIIKDDVAKLNEITTLEQIHTDRLASLEKKREDVVKDIATVLNKDVEKLTIKNIVNLLKGQDKEQNMLSDVHDKLKNTLAQVVAINDINKQLIQESLELVDFNINYINGLNQMPETANYTREAYNSGSGLVNSRFDAKN